MFKSSQKIKEEKDYTQSRKFSNMGGTTSTSNKKKVSPAVAARYKKVLESRVASGSFDIEKYMAEIVVEGSEANDGNSTLATTTTIPTGRTIRTMVGWEGHWPALREFLQNTIDHLQLIDPRTGRRRSCVELQVIPGATVLEESSDDDEQHDDTVVATFRFVLLQKGLKDGDAVICTITAQRDCLIIEQRYTHPLHPRALETGVPDTRKQNTQNSSAAGEFGDGFKAGAVAILAQRGSLVWHFYHSGQEISWYFEGQKQESVGGFDESELLFVRVGRRPDTRTAADYGQDNVMRQIIQLKGIGQSFAGEGVQRLQVFWDLDMTKTIRASFGGYSNGDFLGESAAQPPIAGGVLGANLKPSPGVYVRGIWVRPPHVSGSIMSFFGLTCLRVTGRDRNDVCIHSLSDAVGWVLMYSNQRPVIKSLLEPLKGKVEDFRQVEGDGGGDEEQKDSGNSWLLQSPDFFNRLLDRNANFPGFGNFRNFILHEILDIPVRAVFTSTRTFKSKDPFILWAIEFLKCKRAPLVPIGDDANRILFKEVDAMGLKDLCVKYLPRNKVRGGAIFRVLRSCFAKIMAFLHEENVNVKACKDLKLIFVHDTTIYIPEEPLDRKLLVKVVSKYNSKFGREQDDERFYALLDAIHDYLPSGKERPLTAADVDDAIKHAERICKDKEISSLPGDEATSESTTEDEEDHEEEISSPTRMDLQSPDDEEKPSSSSRNMPCPNDGTRPPPSRMKPSSPDDSATAPRNSLDEKIQKACMDLGDESYKVQAFPKSKAAPDDAGPDDPVSISELTPIAVEACLGGGTICCDEATVAAIYSKSWDASTCNRIRNLRRVLDDAIERVGECIPTAKPLLGLIKHGYDSVGDRYFGFCSYKRGQIIINLYAYSKKFPCDDEGAATLSNDEDLIHRFVVTVTHELAHWLEGPGKGHGPIWRETHVGMLIKIMAKDTAGKLDKVDEVPNGGGAKASTALPKRKRARRS